MKVYQLRVLTGKYDCLKWDYVPVVKDRGFLFMNSLQFYVLSPP